MPPKRRNLKMVARVSMTTTDLSESAYMVPRLSPVAVLTAALQEPGGITRADFTANPVDKGQEAGLMWVEMAKELGVGLELSAALAYADAYVPAESMLDPVALHLGIRTKQDGTGTDLTDKRAQEIVTACGNEVKVYDLGFFDNPLHRDVKIRAQVKAHLLRCARAAAMLKDVGCDGIAGFVGRDFTLSMEQNLAHFEKVFVPILKELKVMGLKFYAEPCPMPGWTTGEMFVHNLAYCPYMWIRLYQICKKHGVEGVFRITYDESHDILMRTTHHASFAVMALAELGFVIARTHGKNQYRDLAATALHTARGQMLELGCEVDGQPHPDPAACLGAWGVMGCGHGQVGIGHYSPAAQAAGLEADWLDHQLGIRDVLGLDPTTVVSVLEHEFPAARKQDQALVMSMLRISVDYMRAADAQADAIYRGILWCRANGIDPPGTPNPMYDIPGLEEKVKAVIALAG
jgi:hypothetical protein